MLVRDVMQHEVVSVAARTTLAEAYRMLQEHPIRHLPVLRDGALVGVVTDRDLRFATSVSDEAHVEVILRVGTLHTHALAAQLRTEGFDITWPPQKPWSP